MAALSTKAQKSVDDARSKFGRELAANPRAKGILNDSTIQLLESKTVSKIAKALLIKAGVDRYLATRTQVVK